MQVPCCIVKGSRKEQSGSTSRWYLIQVVARFWSLSQSFIPRDYAPWRGCCAGLSLTAATCPCFPAARVPWKRTNTYPGPTKRRYCVARTHTTSPRGDRLPTRLPSTWRLEQRPATRAVRIRTENRKGLTSMASTTLLSNFR
ncbi:hypothetical protein CORC01_06777 [Colletotrichum orchidophilum]|uniref:Uncharacterized protein n=1 Tax=Colletotrichum orchidophilum TaxID=1209926 RepID=A0A1G4B906_9PEZI|nr:uncharacterized protein CORC01_06777 [Colletotrichum orchidophilum]OHE97914.1 hypothetical protein CORC01_06777 [Colletotrichum orchidophilum]